jgi:hypothetical protein
MLYYVMIMSLAQQHDLDIVALSAGCMVALQTTVVFAVRYYRTRAPMHGVGILAGLTGVSYCVFRLCYWIAAITDCNAVLLIGGILQSSSIALALLHLLFRADALNRCSPQWFKWRLLALFVTLVNLVAFAFFVSLRTVSTYRDAYGTRRCAFQFNIVALRLKYVSQTVNHIVQTSLFVYPLLRHVDNMNKTIKNNQEYPGLNIYRNLAARAIVAMVIATGYTSAITVCIFFYDSSAAVRTVVVPLSVIDMSLTLGSIAYAVDTKVKPVRRTSHLVVSSEV